MAARVGRVDKEDQATSRQDVCAWNAMIFSSLSIFFVCLPFKIATKSRTRIQQGSLACLYIKYSSEAHSCVPTFPRQIVFIISTGKARYRHIYMGEFETITNYDVITRADVDQEPREKVTHDMYLLFFKWVVIMNSYLFKSVFSISNFNPRSAISAWKSHNKHTCFIGKF